MRSHSLDIKGAETNWSTTSTKLSRKAGNNFFIAYQKHFYFHLHIRSVLFSEKLSCLSKNTHMWWPSNTQRPRVVGTARSPLCRGAKKKSEVAPCEEGYHEDRLCRRGTFSCLPSAAFKTNFSASLVNNKQFGGSLFPARAQPYSLQVILLIRLHPSPNLVLVIEVNSYDSDLWPARIPTVDREHIEMNQT